MNNADIALSIIIPTYNCEDFFGETLKNLLSERPDNCEIILSDDGSDDATVRLLEEFEGHYDNLKIIRNDHHGVSAARNAGLDVARGEFVAFMDCDDCLHEGFLTDDRLTFKEDADLYIYAIERRTQDGLRQYWKLEDRTYPDSSDFADEYVRSHKLLLYSVCNKFYRRSLIDKINLRFDEGMQFGEDRLFNFQYLTACGKIISSGDIMQDYIQRSGPSLSTCYVPHYFDTIMKLHRMKMEYILSLSHGTTEDERLSYIAYDLVNEIEKAINRCLKLPKEREETIASINKLAFLDDEEMEEVDFIVVLGSRNCGYKAEKAMQIGSRYPECRYILSGGNPHVDGIHSESEFMANYLLDKGIPSDKILIENASDCTYQNLINSKELIDRLRGENQSNGGCASKKAIGVVSAGFHMPRIKTMMEKMPEFKDEKIRYISAFGPNTRLDNWFLNEYGKELVFSEFHKRIIDLKCAGYIEK